MQGAGALARVTTKGQVTIPAEIRRALGIEEGDEVVFRIERAGVAALRVRKRGSLSALAGALPATRPWLGKADARDAIGKALDQGAAADE